MKLKDESWLCFSLLLWLLKTVISTIWLSFMVYLTDLFTRESVLLRTNEHPILQLSLQDDMIWVATMDSSVYGWKAEGRTPQKLFEKGGSFLAGNLSFSRARASLEGSAPVPVSKEPSFIIPGVPAIIQHEILNNRRHVLTKDTAGSVKLWEITRGAVIEDFGKATGSSHVGSESTTNDNANNAVDGHSGEELDGANKTLETSHRQSGNQA
ncbi:hypothetical protein ABZP36_021654 [Zizania latifolia]